MTDAARARQVWERFGASYDRTFFEASAAFAEEALTIADVAPGMSLLDVAAGSGALSIPAGRRGAEVLATDISPTMLAILERRAREAGLANVRTAVMDGTALDVAAGSFDRVCSQFGVMFFPDPGLAEMYRVTAPGGRGVVIIFGRPERVPMSLFAEALARAVPDAEGPPDPFRVTDPGSLEPMMEAAGFADVTVHVREPVQPMASGDELWQWMSAAAPGFAMYVEMLPEDRRSAVHDALLEAATERYGTAFTEVPLEIIIGIGHKI